MPETVLEPPPAIENPVIPSGMDLSKKLFNEAMEAEKAKPSSETTNVVSPDSTEAKPTPPPPKEPEQPVIPEKKSDQSVEPSSPAAKATVPQELLTGKKAEPKVDDAIAEIDAMVLPKNAKPEQVANFNELKEKAKQTIEAKLARIAELESKTSDGSSKAEIEAAQERIKAAETRAKELESQIERISFMESPRFKSLLTKEAGYLARAKEYFTGTDINPEIIEVAARTTGQQRAKVLREAGADPELIGLIAPYLERYDDIQSDKSSALENWKTESTQMLEQHKAQQEAALAQRKAEEDKVWDSVASKLKGEVAAFQKFDAQDAWNERSDKLMAEWKRVYNGEDVGLETVADYLGKGIAYDAEHEIRMALTEELNKALAENAKLKAAKPGAGNGQVLPSGTSDENLSPTEQAKRRFNTEMAKARGV